MVGILAGAVVLLGFIGLGILLTSRVGSPVPVIVLALGGVYAGWLVGVIVYGAIRGGGTDGQEARER